MPKFVFFIILICASLVYSRSWQRISGSYSMIEYQTGNETVAESLLVIAENSVKRLSYLFSIPEDEFRKEPVRIILVDALDVSNGFALDNTIVIYTLSSAYVPTWTGTQKWYEQVLNHELVHVVTFRKIKRTANIFGTLAYLTTPRWFYEGIAQYYAEDWNAFRGDFYLKNALFDGILNLGSLYNMENGRLLYATGNAFVRYLVDQYSDSSLVKLMSYDSTAFYFDFSEAFTKVYGASIDKIFKKFMRHMVIYYGAENSVYEELNNITPLPTYGSRIQQVIPLNSADSTYLISMQAGSFDQYRTAAIVRHKKNKMVLIRKLFDNFHTNLVISPDKNQIAFGRVSLSTESNINGLSFDWFVYDRSERKTQSVLQDKHIRFAAFPDEKTLVLSEVNQSGTAIISYNLGTADSRIIARTPMPVGRMAVWQHDMLLLEAQRVNGYRDLFYLSADTLTGLTNDAQDDRLPVIVNDNHFVFTRIIDRKPAVCLFNLRDRSFRILHQDLNDYWTHDFIRSENKIILMNWEAGNHAVFSTIFLDSLLSRPYTPAEHITPQRFQSWKIRRPNPDLISTADTTAVAYSRENITTTYFPLEHGLTLALPVFDDTYGFGLYGISSWFEILQRQALATTFVVFPGQIDRSLIFFSHFLKLINFDITSVYYHGPVIFSHSDNSHIDVVRDLAAVNISRNFALKGNPRWWFQPALGFIWNRYNVKQNESPLLSNKEYINIRTGGILQFAYPTRLYPLLPQRQIGFYGFVHQSIEKNEDFRVLEGGLFGGTKIFSERLGLRSHISYLNQKGNLSRTHSVGIDRFFETNLPRDYGYTRAVRGVREDIYGNKLLWISSEMVIYLAQNPGLKVLFIPLYNLALSGFHDFAEISAQDGTWTVSGFGGELTSGSTYFRFGLGYAHARRSDGTYDNQWYWRLSLSFPQPALGIP